MENEPKTLPDSLQDSQKVFQGIRFDVHAVQLSGTEGSLYQAEVVIHPGAVVILPLLDADNIVMIHNQRFAVGEELWELPAGTLEKGETPEETAARELTEEAGYKAEVLKPWPFFYTTPGICTEVIYPYCAAELTEVGQNLDANEKIRVETLSLKRALELAREGAIRDAKTLTVLYYYALFHAPRQ